jgi:hypothetical protein
MPAAIPTEANGLLRIAVAKFSCVLLICLPMTDVTVDVSFEAVTVVRRSGR